MVLVKLCNYQKNNKYIIDTANVSLILQIFAISVMK